MLDTVMRPMPDEQLVLLLNWLSTAFPTGAFAHSHGLEWAIERGWVCNRSDPQNWIEDLLTRGSAWNDVVLFSLCWTEADPVALNELALALSSGQERFIE